MNIPQETYFAFYLPQAIWIGDFLPMETYEEITKAKTEVDQVVYTWDGTNVKFKACRDGLIYMRAPGMERGDDSAPPEIDATVQRMDSCLEYVNAFFLLLDSSLLEEQRYAHFELTEITKNDISVAVFQGDRLLSTGRAGHTVSYSSSFRQRRELLKTLDGNLERSLLYHCPKPSEVLIAYRQSVTDMGRTLCWNASLPHVLAPEVFDKAASRLDLFIDGQPASVRWLAALAKAVSQYKVGDFEAALTFAWFLIEKLLARKWKLFLDQQNCAPADGKTRINSKRMEILTGNAYSANILSQQLELAGKISLDLLNKLDRIRSYRNKIVHSKDNFRCASSQALEAIQTAAELISDATGVTFEFNGGLHAMGF